MLIDDPTPVIYAFHRERRPLDGEPHLGAMIMLGIPARIISRTMGLSEGYLSRVRTGDTRPTLETTHRLRQLLSYVITHYERNTAELEPTLSPLQRLVVTHAIDLLNTPIEPLPPRASIDIYASPYTNETRPNL